MGRPDNRRRQRISGAALDPSGASATLLAQVTQREARDGPEGTSAAAAPTATHAAAQLSALRAEAHEPRRKIEWPNRDKCLGIRQVVLLWLAGQGKKTIARQVWLQPTIKKTGQEARAYGRSSRPAARGTRGWKSWEPGVHRQ
jgi:hypothetical protein